MLTSDWLSCYYKLPDKTEEEFLEDGDGRRWFRTGDIGQVSCDWWTAGHVTTVISSDWSVRQLRHAQDHRP